MQRLAPGTVLWCSVGTPGGPMGPEGRWSSLRTVLCPPHKGVETCDLSPVQPLNQALMTVPHAGGCPANLHGGLEDGPKWVEPARSRQNPRRRTHPRHLCLPLQSSLAAPHSGSPSMGEPAGHSPLFPGPPLAPQEPSPRTISHAAGQEHALNPPAWGTDR